MFTMGSGIESVVNVTIPYRPVRRFPLKMKFKFPSLYSRSTVADDGIEKMRKFFSGIIKLFCFIF